MSAAPLLVPDSYILRLGLPNPHGLDASNLLASAPNCAYFDHSGAREANHTSAVPDTDSICAALVGPRLRLRPLSYGRGVTALCSDHTHSLFDMCVFGLGGLCVFAGHMVYAASKWLPRGQ